MNEKLFLLSGSYEKKTCNPNNISCIRFLIREVMRGKINFSIKFNFVFDFFGRQWIEPKFYNQKIETLFQKTLFHIQNDFNICSSFVYHNIRPTSGKKAEDVWPNCFIVRKRGKGVKRGSKGGGVHEALSRCGVSERRPVDRGISRVRVSKRCRNDSLNDIGGRRRWSTRRNRLLDFPSGLEHCEKNARFHYIYLHFVIQLHCTENVKS